ncbi:nickel ABC transporter permease [Nitratireductor sp. StC3]|uniref:nickel ABC transporter permease n=1 Tax=Nitratireductor sp. StC3 TaxID=2126741 RepID=UPI000D0D2AB8|nr:nickel ABC transporter permease [Nitratireductor sp. StC3]PSM15836.1 peptide ABC transporter permease [Nitratireductor sp. StC3]
MIKYILRRVIQSIVVLFGAVVFSFLILRVIPGDPAVMMLSDLATPEEIERVRQSLGVDRPIWVQFLVYLKQIFTGDFGVSYRSQTPALGLVLGYLPATFQLAAAALLITIVVSVPLGAVAAIRKGSWIDSLLSGFALVGQSVPVFWLGIMLILIFSVHLRWLPTSGQGGLQHLVLPAVTLAAAQVALVARIMRSSMLEVIRQDYIRTARAKGLSETSVVVGHALRNALAPVVTVLGLQIGNLLGGAIITETVFGWPGAGNLLVNSIGARDYPVVQAMIVISALVFVVTNLIVDIIYVILDPRVSYN